MTDIKYKYNAEKIRAYLYTRAKPHEAAKLNFIWILEGLPLITEG